MPGYSDIFGGADPVGDIFSGQYDRRDVAAQRSQDLARANFLEAMRRADLAEKLRMENAAAQSPYIQQLLREALAPAAAPEQAPVVMPGSVRDFNTLNTQVGPVIGPRPAPAVTGRGAIEAAFGDLPAVVPTARSAQAMGLSPEQAATLTAGDAALLKQFEQPEPEPMPPPVQQAPPPPMQTTVRAKRQRQMPRNAAEFEMSKALLPQIIQRRAQQESTARAQTGLNFGVTREQSRQGLEIWKEFQRALVRLEGMRSAERVAGTRAQAKKEEDRLKYPYKMQQEERQQLGNLMNSYNAFVMTVRPDLRPEGDPMRVLADEMRGEIMRQSGALSSVRERVGEATTQKTGVDVRRKARRQYTGRSKPGEGGRTLYELVGGGGTYVPPPQK